MKKIQFISLYLLSQLIVTRIAAQTPEPVLASVTYQFIYVNDTNNKDNPIRENMILCLGATSSKYTRLLVETKRQQARKAAAEAAAAINTSPGKTVAASGIPMAVVYGPGYTLEALFQHTKENKLNKISPLGMNDYLIELPLPKIDWKINKETRQIGGYTCQKAVGNFAGRTYNAWFTSELPFQNGPWKLSGLPGLILEATDTRNEVSFLFKEISKDTAFRDTGIETRRIITVNDKAFERVKEAWINDPVGVMQSQLPAGANTSARLLYRDSTGKATTGEAAQALLENYQKSLKNYNNPLELTKK